MQPPNRIQRRVAAHPVLGSLFLGALFAAASFVANAVVLRIDVSTATACAFLAAGAFYGSSMSFSTRYKVRRWDESH